MLNYRVVFDLYCNMSMYSLAVISQSQTIFHTGKSQKWLRNIAAKKVNMKHKESFATICFYLILHCLRETAFFKNKNASDACRTKTKCSVDVI